MHKIIFYFFVALFFNMLSYARPVLVMGENVKRGLKELDHNDARQFKQSDKKSVKKVSYVVEIDESSNKTFKDLKKRVKNGFRVEEYGKNELSLKNEKVRIDLSELESDRFTCANKMVKSVMPDVYANQWSLVSVDEKRSFSMSQGVKIEGRTFNFKRVFDGRIVRNNDNFLKIRVGKNGYLESADVAMQDLKKIAEEIDIDGDFAENEATLDSVLTVGFENAYVYDESGLEKEEKIEKVETGSVAEAYCEIYEGQKKKLFPCLSYATKINLSENRKFDYIIDVPHSRKSWSDYHAKKSSVTFGSRRF